MQTNDETPIYSPLTLRLMVQLAAPHTWPASIFPVLLATALAVVSTDWHSVSGIMVCVLLCISVLFQSAANAINDYYDYAKGTDTAENQPDETDAVLVYNRVNPRSVLLYGLFLMGAAFLLGIYCVLAAGWPPLVIALVGALLLLSYSGGRLPTSYLPLGEIISGITFGALITFASYYCLTLVAQPLVFVWSLPLVLAVALIMLTNNGCDIDKDKDAGRKTLPVLLGHDSTLRLYHGIVYAWVASICLIVLVWFRDGWIVLPFMLLAIHPLGRALLANPLTAESRPAAFAQCTSLNVALGAFYPAAILASSSGVCLL